MTRSGYAQTLHWLNSVDCLATVTEVMLFGVSCEWNPAMRALLAYNVFLFIVVKLLGVGLLGAFLGLQRMAFSLVALCMIYTVTLAMHAVFLFG